MAKLLFRAVCVVSAALAATVWFGPLRAQTAAEDEALAQELVRELRNRRPARETEITGVLRNRAPRQPIYRVPMKLSIEFTTNGWRDIYETEHIQFHPAEILIIEHEIGAPTKYFYGRSTDPAVPPKPEPLSTNRIWRTFANSDFYVADFGLQFLHWPEQRVIDREMRKSRSCRVVESINPNPTPSEYSRVLSWLDYETGNLIMAEAYDHENKLLKEFAVKEISRSEGRVELREIEIRNAQTDSRTNLEFDVEFEE